MATSAIQFAPTSKAALWTGRVMSALPMLLVLFGSVVKLMRVPSVIEAFTRTGLPERLILPVGTIELLCCVFYVIPQTAVLGAILMTGLLGGATITTLRIGDPTYPMPVILGMLAWGGLFMRDPRLRELIPLRKKI
jgi:DoxX-like family